MTVAARFRALGLVTCAAALAGCAGGSGNRAASPGEFVPSASRAAVRPSPPQSQVTLVYNFLGGSGDGGYAYGPLVEDKSGALYGTTNGGGPADQGTVYKLTPNGSTYTESVIHTFGGAGDGSLPYGGLAFGKKGVLYGTTYSGGAFGDGTVFALTPSGSGYTESIVHSFAGSPDGGNPYAGPAVDASGTIFGTTLYGGTGGAGTVYALKPSGSGFTESVLHDFSGPDGSTPYGGVLVTKKGIVYGTTRVGGANGAGIAYSLSPSGGGYVYGDLHDFAAGSDGANPYAGLVASGSDLYGTTEAGGAGAGTVFKLSVAKGKVSESVVHSFANGPADGAEPYGGVVLGKKGALYGTTYTGGANGQGAIFEIVKSGKSLSESLVASFPGYPGSANPYSGVIETASGELFGTTFGGGTMGYGTVYAVTP